MYLWLCRRQQHQNVWRAWIHQHFPHWCAQNHNRWLGLWKLCSRPVLPEMVCRHGSLWINRLVNITAGCLLKTDILSTTSEELPGPCPWASWGSWTSCSESCSDASGYGDQTRTREIESPEVNDGIPCNATADGNENQSCMVECPGEKYIIEIIQIS